MKKPSQRHGITINMFFIYQFSSVSKDTSILEVVLLSSFPTPVGGEFSKEQRNIQRSLESIHSLLGAELSCSICNF